MSNLSEFEKLKEAIEAIKANEVKVPDMPVDIFIQETENMYQWALDDKEQLFARGLKQEVLDAIPEASGACRHAEALWFKQRYGKQEAEKQWAEKSPAAYDLRNDLIYEFEFAFVGNATLLGRVNDIKTGNGHPDMIQDLANLAVLGNENLSLLTATSFDPSLLATAADTSDTLAEILARATGDKAENSEAKTLRDKAYTYLKLQADEVRRYGKFVFRKDKDRLAGYIQHYKNTHR